MNYLEAAVGAAEWLLPQATTETNLYAGSAGVLLTMLDAHQATGDQRFRDRAEDIGASLRGAIRGETYPGLYVGLAGTAFALRELGDEEGVAAALAAIPSQPRVGTDMISGAAGTLCVLVAEGVTELAASEAAWLVSVGEPVGDGMEWRYDLKQDRYMPGFSHGAAGISFALAKAGRLEEALAGGRYLAAAGERSDKGFRVYHSRPGGEAEFPLGWCHGPAGTARLFQVLSDATGDPQWTELRDACAQTIRGSGIPERREPGFWDNVALCCGSASVASFFLGLHRRTDAAPDLAFARLLADDIVSHATVDDAGVRWSNLEHRAPNPVLPAEPGLMQGAAGIAQLLFELDRFVNGDGSYRRWPDNPF